MKLTPQTLSQIRLVSWDVDGTLYSDAGFRVRLFLRFLSEARRHGWAHAGGKLRAIRAFHREVNEQRKGLASRVLPFRSPRPPHEREWFEQALRSLGPRRDARVLLAELQKRNLCQVVLSDFECDYKLRALGLEGYFQKTYCGEALGHWKPSPELFRKIQRDFGILPSQHLHIGDRHDTDGAGAEASGCVFFPI